jgi:hypothetical protein
VRSASCRCRKASEAAVRGRRSAVAETIPASGRGFKMIDQWIGTTGWDVIHFNWGLHDLCYRNPDLKVQDNRDRIKGTITTSLWQYEKNLDHLVQRLGKTGTTLIWAQTTVVPEGEAGRFAGDDDKYNQAAATVMKKYDIMIDDIHTLTEGFSDDLFVKSGDVHYPEDGYRRIAAQVADKIRAASGHISYSSDQLAKPESR